MRRHKGSTMDNSHHRRFAYRRRGSCSVRRRKISFLLLLTAIGLSFDASRNISKSRRLSPLVFVSSFTSNNYVRPQSISSIPYIKTPNDRKKEKSFCVSQNELTVDGLGYRNYGGLSALSPTEPSPTTMKAPAPTDWVVVEEYPIISADGIDPYTILENRNSSEDIANSDSNENGVDKYINAIERLHVTQHNLTLPIAIMSLDPARYPTLSNARKACRQGKIAFRLSSTNDSSAFRKGLVGDRVYPLDFIVRRELYKNLVEKTDPTSYETLGDGFVKSKFQNLHVAYEDDCMAVVVKPAGLLVHPQGKNGGWGRKNNVLNALPYFLKKPVGTTAADDDDNLVLKQPVPVHRLDFATSGLLVAAKTKGASRLLAQEFEYRKARKTYTAMVYGIPIDDGGKRESLTIPSFFGPNDYSEDLSIDDEDIPMAGGFIEKNAAVEELDIDDPYYVDTAEDDVDYIGWNLADCFLDSKRARTRWRVLGSHICSVPIQNRNADGQLDDAIHSIDVPISIVEMKPKTGRYHQLRRTMAWLYKTPMVGDPVYATNFLEENFLPENAELKEQQQMRDYSSSLMLCSNEIDIAHPYFNTPAGRREWEDRKNQSSIELNSKKEKDLSTSSLYENDDGVVRVAASIQLPKKFTKFIGMMERKRQAK